MRKIVFVLVSGGLLGLAACTKSEDAAQADPAAAGAEPAAQPAAAAPEPKVEEPAIVTGSTSLKKAPNEEKKIDVDGKKVSNWAATLSRGEEVVVLGKEGDYTHVRTSDETEGWIKTDKLVRAADVKLATLAEESKVWRRPDVVALDANKTIAPGSLLLVLKEKEQFAEVDYPRSEYGSGTAWIMADKLVTDANEVAAAKLIMKIRYLREKKDATADSLTEVAKAQYASSRLIGLLDEAAPAPEEGAEGAAEPAAPAGDATADAN